MATAYQDPDDHLDHLVSELKRIREATTDLYSLADMTDAVTFNQEDGLLQSGMPFSYPVAQTQAIQRPSSTACAYVNEYQLILLQARSRAFASLNPYWMAARENRISYTVGNGHVLSVSPRDDGEEVPKDLKRKVVSELDKFRKLNKYRRRQGEKITRLDRDGEYFLRFFENHRDGILRVRFVEPLLVRTPPGLGPEGGVWFGIAFEGEDYETPVRYHVRPATFDGSSFTADQIARWTAGVQADDIQHRTANVDLGSPRGLPTTYALQESLTQATSTRKSMGRLVDVRARIALIRKQVNATLSQIQPLLNRNRSGSIQGTDGITRSAFQLPYGSIMDTNDQRQYEFPAQNIETDKIVHSLKADLQAVAAALGLADFVLAADSLSSFSNALVKEGPMDRSISRLQQDVIDDDIEVYERALTVAAGAGRLPGDVLEIVRIDLLPPSVIARNRIQDTQADEILVRNGAMSSETMAMRANLDPANERAKAEANPSPATQGAAGGVGDKRAFQAPVDGKATVRGVPSGSEPGPAANAQRSREGLEESSGDARSKDKPTTEDLAMAAIVITPEWVAQTKREILALPRTEYPLNPAQAGEYEPGVRGILLGGVDDQRVWAVDMRALSVKYDLPDLVVAGNSERWSVIPASDLLVDWVFTAADRACDLLHECAEYKLMRDGKWAYARAHRVANGLERDWLLELRPELRGLAP
jgi:hypothetical protein